MAVKTKKELKDVFMGLSEIMTVQGGISDFATVTPELEIPVVVDSLTMSMGEPTKNSVKVHGLQADWAVTYTPGEFSFACTIPSVHKDICKYFFGEANDVSTSSVNGVTYKGFSLTMKNVVKEIGLVLMNESGDKCVLVKKLSVNPRFVFENGSTEPIGIALTGSLVVDETETNDDDIAFLTKGGE